jgi:phage terminase large subunit-like protein
MRTVNLTIPKPHRAQQRILSERKRFNVEACGRRFGKTTLDINEAEEVLLAGYPVGGFFPTYKMLSETWRQFVEVFAPIRRSKNEQEHRLELVTGGVLEMWSMDAADTARGRKYKRVFIDEAAMIPNLMEIWNAVIRPMLIDYKGDAFIKSTPKGLNGFWQMFQIGQDENNPDWKSWQFPTADNPHIPASEIEAMRLALPEIIYRQEILAEFIDDQGSVFRRVQEAARVEELTDPIPGRQYSAGVDVAASVDYTVISVMDDMSKELVYLDRFNRVDYNLLIDRLESVYKRWGLRTMKVESNSIGQPVIDALKGRGLAIIPFMTTSSTKQVLIQNLQAAFENGAIGIINNPVLIGELLSFESKRNASGSFSYSAPAGMHDDTVMSLAIAWDAITGTRPADLIGWI